MKTDFNDSTGLKKDSGRWIRSQREPHHRSADLQSAGSPNFIRLAYQILHQYWALPKLADCKSAIQQIANLRYKDICRSLSPTLASEAPDSQSPERGRGEGNWLAAYPSAARMTAILIVAAVISGCGSSPKKQNKDFFTSGSKDADQRASQRMAKQEQLSGSGEGSGEKNVREAKSEGGTSSSGGSTNKAAKAETKLALYDRLGQEQGIAAIVDDFLPRVIQDPRVNWQRKDVKRGGLFRSNKVDVWQATPANVEQLKKHFVQFLSLATGGPAHYEGKEIASSHSGMKITNPEFDAAVGDLKASLDRLKIPNTEQKELLAIVESTRPQIVTVR